MTSNTAWQPQHEGKDGTEVHTTGMDYNQYPQYDQHHQHHQHHQHNQYNAQQPIDITSTGKTKWQRLWPALACGAGLFSDGYLNGVIGSVNTMLKRIYGAAYKSSSAQSNVSSITFAGTVVGMLFFGWTSDNISRKWSLMVSTIIVILFAILATGSYGGGSANGLFTALVVYRFFLGIGIGGEYPAGSVACAESTGELEAGSRNKWFILFTNVQIDLGFLIAAIVPMIVVLATGENNLGTAWRICLGLGIIPPLSLFYLRLKLKEPEAFARSNLKKAITPYGLAFKLYGPRLFVVSLIWFIYDFSAYSFGNYSSSIVDNALGVAANPDYVPPLWKTFGWNTLITFFYMPGCVIGAFVSDKLGPRKTLCIGVFVQGVVGFIMTAVYPQLNKPENIGGFCVVYGLFLALGELGPGNNIGLLASKTCATPIRGRYYGLAAAIGKIGAFVGNYVFPYIEAAGGKDPIKQLTYPFYASSAMCIFSAFLAFFFLPEVGQDTIEFEDTRFRGYLASHGWDTRKLDGDAVHSSTHLAHPGNGVGGPGYGEVQHVGKVA